MASVQAWLVSLHAIPCPPTYLNPNSDILGAFLGLVIDETFLLSVESRVV